MNTEPICPSCKKPLPEGAPQSLCPECLMKVGLGSASGQPGGTPRFVPPSVADLAKLFPQLEILELIGQGGMGAVYRARQPGLDRLVAIKILPPETTASPGFAERFTREARALARLNHPNIVSVFDFGQAGGLHYFLMEYVDGLNLRRLIQGGRLSPHEALQIVPQMCDALQFAHDEGIVHRDIKPENVMVDKRGRVKITDFGLAKLVGQEPKGVQLTGAGDVMGTPQYMAPEQMEKPNSVDHRADIFSLGVVFYELLTGELPLGKFAPPSRMVAVDVRLDEIVLHTLEKEPERRYQHASQVKTDVETITHTDAAAPTPPPSEKPLEFARWQEAQRQVKGPGVGLVVTAILNWVGIPLVVLAAAYFTLHNEGESRFFMLALPLAALVLSSLMLVAGLKMMRLQAYWLAVIGSVLAAIVTPGNIVGLPVGIWSLVVLSQKRVRDWFGKEHPLPGSAQVSPANASGGAWKVAAVVVAALMLLCALPVGLILASVTLPALHSVKLAHAYAAEYGPAQVVTLKGVQQGQGSQVLDLDRGQVIEVPAEIAQRTRDEVVNWGAEQGLDLAVMRENGQWVLFTGPTNELVLTPVANDAWTRPFVMPPPKAVRLLSETNRTEVLWTTDDHSFDGKLPVTFWFKTANGGSGLLQITAFAQDPDSVTLRFKTRKATGGNP